VCVGHYKARRKNNRLWSSYFVVGFTMEHSFIWILRMFQHSRPNVWLVPLQFEFKFVKHDLAYALDLIYFLGVGDDMGSSKLKYCSFWSLFARNQDSICVLRSANLLEGILYKNDSWTKIFVLTFFMRPTCHKGELLL